MTVKEREREGSEKERERRGEYENREGKEKSMETDVPKLYAYNECEHSVMQTNLLEKLKAKWCKFTILVTAACVKMVKFSSCVNTKFSFVLIKVPEEK